MKKFVTTILAAMLILSPVGNGIFQDHSTTVEAKKYKSGKKSFNMQNNRQNNQSNFQKKQKEEAPKNNSAAKKTSSGGLMKGLMFGGLAGLLFGSLFANMGVLGSMLGLLINVGAIILVIAVIRKIFSLFKQQKKSEDMNPWGS